MQVTVNKEKNTLVLGIGESDEGRAKHQGRVFVKAMKSVLVYTKNCEAKAVLFKRDIAIIGLMVSLRMPKDVASCVIEALVDFGALSEKDGLLSSVKGMDGFNAGEGKLVGKINLN